MDMVPTSGFVENYRSQWRIQDFPEGGANFQNGSVNIFFGQKLHENERIWTPGARVPGAPLRFVTGNFFQVEFLHSFVVLL